MTETQAPASQALKEPVALIGIGCRFPGGVHDPESFWKLLSEGVDTIQEIPSDRIDVDRYYDPRPGIPGKMATRWGGFLGDIDSFDAAFFGISPREAERMDPQQRLLLEVAWEALEDAGQAEARLAGTEAGVFVGVWLNDFEARLFRNPAEVDFYMTTGSGRYTAAGRLSYCLGLQGPSLSLDTACSSSLVAVHLACQSLLNGECSLALAGGVNVILQPHITIAYSQSKMMAPDGRCKFGDARADGYVRSEGAAVVVLKRLSQALADGDPIYALIRGSAVNNDGRSSGYLTTPAIEGQEMLLEAAYRNAGVPPGEVAFIEAHGTGTYAGDPVEIKALGRVLARGRANGSRCAVGSVKTNLGHTEGAAGMAGLIKSALALKHRQLPASLHLQAPNPEIPWDELPLYIPRKLTTFPDSVRPLIAGVSAFGIAGTNAHVVLEEAPRRLPGSTQEHPAWNLLTLSARSNEALKAVARAYSQFLEDVDGPALSDICYTARQRRTHHEHRLAVVVQNRAAAAAALKDFIHGQPSPWISSAHADLSRRHRIVFVFPGQGSQWLGMGRELLQDQPVFRHTLLQFDQAMQPFVDWSILEQLALEPGDSGYRMDEIAVIQPVLLAIEIALAELWRSWGVEPEAVIGHSLGEVGAAYLAGALSLQEAAQVICLRSQLLQRIRGKGGMAVVGLPASKTQELIQEHADRLSIAVSNSFSSTVIAGDPEALNLIMARLQAEDIFCRPVKVDVAAHSPQVEPLRAELVDGLAGLRPQPTRIPFYSTATAQVQPGTSLDAGYWGLNLRSPVSFAAMTEKLLDDGFTLFLELSPHPVLLSAIEDTVHHLEKEAIAAPSLWRNEPEFSSLLRVLGKLHTAGVALDFDRIFPMPGEVVRLPQYPWQRKRYWLAAADAATEWQPSGAADDPLLGRRLTDLAHLPGHTLWENRVDNRFRSRAQNLPRGVDGGLGNGLYLSLALAAAEAVAGNKLHTVTDLIVRLPIPEKSEEDLYLQSVFIRDDDQSAQFRIYSRKEASHSWQEHVTARIRLSQAPAEWLYHVKWVQKDLSQAEMSPQFPAGGHWLIFADREGVGAALAERLQAHGQTCRLVYPDAVPAGQASGRLSVHPGNRQDFIELPEIIGAEEMQRCLGIFYLWNLDIARKETPDLSSVEADQRLACHAIVYLAQALVMRGGEQTPRLWVVTRGAQLVLQSGTPLDSESLPRGAFQALAWGLGRSLALELPGLWGGLIDLADPVDPAVEANWLLEQVSAMDQENEVAYRDGQRWVARLAPGSDLHGEVRPLMIHPDATYLITGGLGSVGLALAGWLADHGARHIVLTSRTGLPERSEWGDIPADHPAGKRVQAIQAIEANHGNVLQVVRADVTDRSGMESLFSEINEKHPIKGIFHAAGSVSFLPLHEIDADALAQVLNPKVTGTWILNELAKDLPLDFFVLFSSAASIWGSQGLAHYAAANHYLDAVAYRRMACGQPAISINWAWLAGESMVSGEMAKLFHRSGLHEMPFGQTLDALAHLLLAGGAQYIVADVNWNTFKPLYEAGGPRPLLSEILVEGKDLDVATETQTSELLHQLSQATGQERKEIMLRHLRTQVAAILGFGPSDPIDIRQGFFKLGMDSMMTVQLRTRLESVLGCSLPPTLAFEYPSILTLAEHLVKEVLPQKGLSSSTSLDPIAQRRTEESQVKAGEQSNRRVDDGASPEDAPSSDKELLDILDQELSRINDLLEGA